MHWRSTNENEERYIPAIDLHDILIVFCSEVNVICLIDRFVRAIGSNIIIQATTFTHPSIYIWHRFRRCDRGVKVLKTDSVVATEMLTVAYRCIVIIVSCVMIVCLFALMIVLLIYCVLSIFVILINFILVICDVDYYYYLYSLYVATLCIERDT